MSAKFLLLIPAFLLFSCGSGNENTEEANTEEPNEEAAEIETSEISGFATIEDATASFLQSLAARDYDDYLTHVINSEIEEELASMIEREDKRQDFLKEFGFSMRNEREYFDDILKFLDEKGLDPASAVHDDLEIIDYEHDHYAPLELREVIVPFPYESYEIDLIYTAVKYNGNWLLTSELSL